MFHSIGIIGHGHFGKFLEELARKILPAVDLKIYSKRFIADQQKFFSLESVCQCDAVVLACSITDYEDIIINIRQLLGKQTVVVDVATVKAYTAELCKKYLSQQPYICTHPMFGPESYQKTAGDVTGYRIIITDSNLPRMELGKVKEYLSGLGFIVFETTPEEHDKYLADTLFLTHYIGQTMKAGDFKRTQIDSVSFSSLMNAVESVQNDEKLFHDVYRYNPFCQVATERFHQAQEAVFKKLPK